MHEKLLFELLNEKQRYENLLYYISQSDIKRSINLIINQINKLISQISSNNMV